MDDEPTLINVVLNKFYLSHPLVDNGCQCYAAVSENVYQDLNLPLIHISQREVRDASGAMIGAFIRGVTYADVEINGFTQKMYFYVVPMLEHPVILGKPWMIYNKAYPIPHLNDVSINDIDKALLKLSNQQEKTEDELKTKIPREFHDLLPLWKSNEAVKLPVHRTGVDHQIERKKDNQWSELKIPFGPLYNMSREVLKA
ncbi:hypothetical protein GcM1_160001 [Golovinomyces cichoracearum]|uniref:Uncharacterized protein n=1 Tax=Golovinomyces cichoracearum TaxID=62708 RepID=A0A420J931_9PEZI|nr:hypothetical protein GcM1_160001 [Golovinomyces cichoracearum]